MGEMILVVDDEPDVARLISLALKDEGFEVRNACGGQEALDLFRTQHVDLLLTDIKMPGMDGLELARTVLTLGGDTEIIFLTGHATVEYAVEALKTLGASDFLTKPLDEMDHLIHAVSKALERRRLRIENRHLLEELKAYGENLEKEVAARTEALRREVREHRRTAESLRRAKEAADAANRAKSEFLANMSHEIRTPMNAIIGFADMLTTASVDPSTREYIDAILSSGKTLLRLIDDILDLSRIEAGRIEIVAAPVSIREVIEEILRTFRSKVDEKSIDLFARVDPDVPDILHMDEVRIRQILLNLTGNAVKFTDSGSVGIYVRTIPEIRGMNRDKIDICIVVEDTGVGIPIESQAVIFDVFRKAGMDRRNYQGTGLGLSITRRLVDLMSGTISFTSEVGRGTTFEIRLNGISIGEREHVPERAEPAVERDRLPPGTRIMIVDDIDFNRRVLTSFFKGQSGEITEAANGWEALQLARSQRPDIILMDIRMPVMDGYEAAKRLKADADLKPIPLLAVTASAMEGDFERILGAGFDAYLLKPLQRKAVIEKVVELLRKPGPTGGSWAQS